MTQQEIDDAVAKVTGEDLPQIRQRGFVLADPMNVQFDPEPCVLPPQVLDWDQVQLERNVALFSQPVL